jgi:hypothetical protein
MLYGLSYHVNWSSQQYIHIFITIRYDLPCNFHYFIPPEIILSSDTLNKISFKRYFYYSMSWIGSFVLLAGCWDKRWLNINNSRLPKIAFNVILMETKIILFSRFLNYYSKFGPSQLSKFKLHKKMWSRNFNWISQNIF